MKLRAMIKIRNEAMIAAREKMGLSQKALAKNAEVPVYLVCRLEKLDYPKHYPLDMVAKLCAYLAVPIDDIFPEQLVSWSGVTTYHVTKEVDVEHLLEWRDRTAKRLIVSAPDNNASRDEELTRLFYMIDTCEDLTTGERAVIRLRYGLHDGKAYTTQEVAKMLGVSTSVVSTREHAAIRKLREMKEWWPRMREVNAAIVDDIIDMDKYKDELEPSDKEVALPGLPKA